MLKTYLYKELLESNRLISRWLKPEDSEVWENFMADPECTAFFPPDIFNNKNRAQIWIERQLSRYQNQEFGLQGIYLKDTQEFVGQCGLLKQETDIGIELEVGYHFIRKFWGMGLATEAAVMFRDFAFENGLSDSLISIIHHENEKSKRVARRNGMKLGRISQWRGMKVEIFRINREDWQSILKQN